MSGWCPRCDAVRDAGDACPECGTRLVSVERPSRERSRPAEPVIEVSAVTEGPPSVRLRVALAVAAVVLMGLAFVAGRGTGHGPPRVAAAATVPTTTSPPQTAPAGERRLDWRARPAGGITIAALSLRRIAGGDPSGDDVGQLTIQVAGLPAGRQLLGLLGLEMLDSGGGVFAGAEERPVAGIRAALVQPAGQAGTYVVDLGPTPGVDTLARISLDGILLSQPPSPRSRIELDTSGSWPARLPLRAVAPATDSLAVDLSALNLPTSAATMFKGLALQVTSAFVGARRAVVALELGNVPGTPPSEAPQALTRQTGAFPISVRLLAGNRAVCERTRMFGEGPESAPLVVVDCPTAPAARLAVEVGAGVRTVPFLATLPG